MGGNLPAMFFLQLGRRNSLELQWDFKEKLFSLMEKTREYFKETAKKIKSKLKLIFECLKKKNYFICKVYHEVVSK